MKRTQNLQWYMVDDIIDDFVFLANDDNCITITNDYFKDKKLSEYKKLLVVLGKKDINGVSYYEVINAK